MQSLNAYGQIIVATASKPTTNSLHKRKLGSTQLHCHDKCMLFCGYRSGKDGIQANQVWGGHNEGVWSEFVGRMLIRHTAVTVDSFLLIGSYSTKQSRNLSVSLVYCSACWKWLWQGTTPWKSIYGSLLYLTMQCIWKIPWAVHWVPTNIQRRATSTCEDSDWIH